MTTIRNIAHVHGGFVDGAGSQGGYVDLATDGRSPPRAAALRVPPCRVAERTGRRVSHRDRSGRRAADSKTSLSSTSSLAWFVVSMALPSMRTEGER